MKYSGTILFSILLLICFNGNAQPYGIKVCGPEFGQTKFPGVYGFDFIYPDSMELQYFYNKGFRMIDIPFRWERVQPKLMGDLDSIEMSRMNTIIKTCNSIGLQVKLTLQNFGRYTMNDKVWVIGSKQLPSKTLADVWKKLASALKAFENIYGFQKKGFEERNSRNQEAFKKYKI